MSIYTGDARDKPRPRGRGKARSGDTEMAEKTNYSTK